ncbi:IS256 family transposase [Listeria seeligeri]|uniref:IS256 family transposase n=1 Tax=Listeria seeligeri TaxID=1640 RepID=UPI0018885359|nr:IS256 family transposase [Listeria seeligeri]MBF2345356.1 IS256 family transposase [Listeria seeligeri]MBF2480181.1 IS256 family transposase [Listeria seeligeri]MBF2599325.1 IS256 family transposase [Listeria seeligeri]
MNDFTTEIVQTLVTKGDLNELFRFHLEKALNTLLRTELTAYLAYDKYERIRFHSGNSRNGTYQRRIKTEYGELTVEIPRERKGEFQQQTLPAYKRTNDTLESTIIHLFEKGVTMSEIADLIEKMYGHHYTPQTVSNMTKVLTEEVNAFKVRSLYKQYAAIFMDATYIPLKRQTVSKEAIYIAIVIREDGTKEVLSYAIAPTESIHIWNELLQDIYSRGVQDVLLFITDGLKAMKDTIHQIYPKVTQSLIENQNLLTFYEFPTSIRRSIYSTNLIESFNKQIKKYSRRKEQFQNEESLERFLVSIFDTYNQKFLNRSHKGFQQVTDTLASKFSE